MHTMNHIWLFLCLLAVPGHAVGVVPQGVQAMHERKAASGKVIARVNGASIYEAQVDPEVESGLATFRKYGMQKEDPNLVQRLQKRALHKLIGDELIHQESRKLSIQDMDTRVKQKLTELEERHGPGQGMERYLRMRHLTLETLKESLSTRIRVDAYLKQQGVLEPKIKETRIRQAYEDNPKGYLRQESVKVSHILIAVQKNAGPEAKDQARHRAEQIRREILEGQDFADMARIHSVCDSAPGGGSLKYVKRGYLPEAFDKVAFAIKEDVLSDVVETQFGYHIVKVMDKKPAGKIPYEEVRDSIMKFLQGRESKKKLAAHVVELKSRAKIELLLAD